MKSLILIITVLISSFTWANTFYDQLCEFNPTWKDYADRAPKGEYQIFETDQAYIQAHLGAVLDILKSNRTKSLNSAQKQSRRNLIHMLDQYRKDGKFPQNYYRSERTPVFIDEHGTHCAVGYLLMKTGNEAVAQRIAATNNYAWVKDINDPALPAWQIASGFSIAELKLIQGAYDSYLDNAMFLWNRYEIPQRPAVMETFFMEDANNPKIWCYGEGENGILNGKWIQNYTAELPWIIGFYENGKRTGKWAEYYQGTDKLCRTEHWANDKLNGVRTRFDQEGKIIEEIVFKDGEAVIKTNYDSDQGLRWVRTPMDSNLVYTKVYNKENQLIAKGHEQVYNPGNLLWFQNIELTVLNTISISSRDNAEIGNGLHDNGMRNFQSPPLVQYTKDEDWIFYKDLPPSDNNNAKTVSTPSHFSHHFQNEIEAAHQNVLVTAYSVIIDSIRITYKDNLAVNYEEYSRINYFDEPWGRIDIHPHPFPYEIYPIIIDWDMGSLIYVRIPLEVKSYTSLKSWENSKGDLFIFRQTHCLIGKMEDDLLCLEEY